MYSLMLSGLGQNSEESLAGPCFFQRILFISSSKQSHACLTSYFPLLCCMHFRTVLHASWGILKLNGFFLNNFRITFAFSLLPNISAISSKVKNPPVLWRSSASKKSDSSHPIAKASMLRRLQLLAF